MPERSHDALRLVFLLDTSTYHALTGGVGPFDLTGKIGEGPSSLEVTAQEVWTGRGNQRFWGPDISEGYLLGHPRILRIIRKDPEIPSNKLRGTFNITYSRLLSPFDHSAFYPDGTVSWSRAKRLNFHLSPDLLLVFDHEYHRKAIGQRGEFLVWPELIAKVEADVPPASGGLEPYIPMIDDLLLLVSFVEGRGCACLKATWGFGGEFVQLYRLDRVVPPERIAPIGEFLIEFEDLLAFLHSAHDRLRQSPQRDLIWSALADITDPGDYTIGANFVRMFTALETLVLAFRRENNLEFVLDTSSQRKKLRRIVKGALEESSLLANDPDKLGLVYENLPSLDRVSFPTALAKMAETLRIEISDTWPILSSPSSSGITLVSIRNMLVHGEHFSELEWDFIDEAGLSLRVLVQRFLLAMLGWDYRQSLSRLSPSRWGDWKEAQARFTQMRRSRGTGTG
jgi:hypothetical protein